MTRHPRSNYYFTTSTKEQKVITTGQHANAASTPKTGLSATLRGLLGFTGISAPKMTKGSGLSKISASHQASQTFIALCALVGAFAFATAAQAEPPRLIQYGTIPTKLPIGVAVDQSSGDLYTAAYAASNINEFDASGSLVTPPSPFGAGNFSGVAVDPVNHDVYVITLIANGAGNVAINTYDPSTGELLSSFEVPASKNSFSGFLTVVQIATDAAGNVYVPVVPKNEVLEYSPAGTLLKTFTGGTGTGALKGPTGVAVDSAGDLWVADAGNNRLEELSPADAPIDEIKSEGVLWPALDGHGDVFAIVKNGADFCGSVPQSPPCSHLVEYDAAGVQVADLGAGSFETGSSLELPPMVAVDERTGRVYVSDAKGEKVWIFGPPVPPRVETELTSEVGVSEAKLGALVNPGGLETTYRFEYDTREYNEGEAPHGRSVPFPEGSVGEGLTSHTVWAAASGLAPGTTYHYRVVATSELAPEGVAGPDRTFTTETAAHASCPNEQLRGGFSANLPDCRAYELVTPPTKTSVQVEGAGPVAVDGNAVGFGTHEVLPGAPTGGNSYVATRGAGGWSSEGLNPLESYTGTGCVEQDSQVLAAAYQLSEVLIPFGGSSRASEAEGGSDNHECNAEGLQVVPGEPVGYHNLLLRDNATGAYRLVNTPPPGVTPADAKFKGASADLSHVVFSELASLVAPAPVPTVGAPEDLYEWDEGVLRLLSVLPDGTPVQGALAAQGDLGIGSPAISTDGSRILFTSGGGLYVRVDGERTVQVDASQTGAAGGDGSFQTLSSDGSTVLFTDENRLTPGSTAASGEPDLYECVLPEGASRCELSDLTVAGAGENADVLKVSPLGSQDSSHVYFTAKGVLASNTREYTNSEGHTEVESAKPGEENLYVWDGGTTTFIATLNSSGSDGGVGAVSPDGSWFAFASQRSLTGYDNIVPGGGPQPEVFLYSAGSDSHPPTLVCASCNPSGEAGAAAQLPPLAQRPISDGGRLFFDTDDALVPSDTNSQVDVYEYEDGRQSLISSGTSPRPSTFAGASESGSDVFFISDQQLVPQDTQEEEHLVYDARVEGGFPAGAAPPPCATADACRVPVSPLPSVFGAPASATFNGAGNLAPPSPAVVKPKPKTAAQLKAEKLAKALKTCRKEKSKTKRASCEASAQKKYGVAKPKKKQNKAKKSAHINRRAPR